MNFIEVKNTTDDQNYIINIDQIIRISSSSNGATIIKFSDGKLLFAEQSYEELSKLLLQKKEG